MVNIIKLTMGNNCCKIFENPLKPEDGIKSSLAIKKPTDIKQKFEEIN